jgi:hypothetical protein
MFKLQFSTGNAAFDGDSAWMEIDSILRAVADRAGDGQTSGLIRDSNGNRIGDWRFQREADDD